MKTKKIISILLVLTSLVTLLAACGGEEKEAKEDRSINPELIYAFGEEMIEGEKETIADLVGGLEDCYKQYQKDKDIRNFLVSTVDAMEPYNGYLKEISNELNNLYEAAESKEEMFRLMTLYVESGLTYNDVTLVLNKSSIDLGADLMCTEQEMEEALYEYINRISEFFYCESIAK